MFENIRNSGLNVDAAKFTNFINTIRGQTPYSTYSIATLLILARLNELEDDVERTPASGNRREVVGGTYKLPDAIQENIKSFRRTYKLKKGATVFKIEHSEDGVTVHYKYKRGRGKKAKEVKKTIKGDYVIATPTAKIISNLVFDPPLPFRKQNAMESIFYFNSAKVFLNFNEPFWASDANNNIPAIPFDDPGLEGTTNGAACIRLGFNKDKHSLICRQFYVRVLV